jgi:hypothetical protein
MDEIIGNCLSTVDKFGKSHDRLEEFNYTITLFFFGMSQKYSGVVNKSK